MITPQKKMVRRFNDNSSRVELRKSSSSLKWRDGSFAEGKVSYSCGGLMITPEG